MLDSAREAVSFTADKTRAHLDQDRLLTLALMKSVEIVGEAAYQIGEDSRSEIPGIPWPQVLGMRHRLVHAYYDVNLDILWDTIKRNLPPLIATLEEALEKRK